jgi:hypothetical protein
MVFFAIIRLLFPDPKVRNRVNGALLAVVVGAAVLYATMNVVLALVVGTVFGALLAGGFWLQRRRNLEADALGTRPVDLSKVDSGLFIVAIISATAAWMANYK